MRLALEVVYDLALAEAANQRVAIAIRHTVGVGRRVGAEIGATDENPVWMGMALRHLRLSECRTDRVVTLGHIGRIPVRRGRAGEDVECAVLLLEFRVLDRLALLGGTRIDRPLPALDRDSAARHLAVGVLRCGRNRESQCRYEHTCQHTHELSPSETEGPD